MEVKSESARAGCLFSPTFPEPTSGTGTALALLCGVCAGSHGGRLEVVENLGGFPVKVRGLGGLSALRCKCRPWIMEEGATGRGRQGLHRGRSHYRGP